MPLLDAVQDLALLGQPLLRAFRQAGLEEQDLIFSFAVRGHHRRGGAAQQLFRTLPLIEVVRDADTGVGPQRQTFQRQRRVDLRHDTPRQLHGVERPLDALGQNGEFGIAQLCQHAVFVDAAAQLLRQRQQQRFTHRRAHHARRFMQRLDADHQQVKTLGAQAGGDMLFQQRVQQRRIWQFGHRVAGAQAAHVGMRLGQRLLIAVVVAHQQAELVVLVQRRQHQLVIGRFVLRDVLQLFGHRAQRVHHQPVHAPGDGHRQDQRQQQVGRQHGRQNAEDKLVHAERIGLQHQIGQRLLVGRHPFQRIERHGNLDRQFKQPGDQRRHRPLRREIGVQRLKLVRQDDIRPAENADRQQGVQHPFGFRHVHPQHRFRQRLAHGVSDILQLLGVVIPALLHKVE